jgi:hypothetical protein
MPRVVQAGTRDGDLYCSENLPRINYAAFSMVTWHRTVLRHGARRFAAFHMTDLFAGVKEYKGLATPDRVAVLDAAITAISTHATDHETQELEPGNNRLLDRPRVVSPE